MARKSKIPDSPQKHRLTLAELASYDDVCSDVMVDNAYFKSRIRKYRAKYLPVRGIKQDEVPEIILHQIVVNKNVTAAEKSLLALPGLKRFQAGLRSKPEKENFISHLRKYIVMYQTDCPWEISTTNRYEITNFEAAVTARRRIRQGEIIKYLTGTLVTMTTEESRGLDDTNRNFSIVCLARMKGDQMFLGPARFANHDCDANARLERDGKDSMKVTAVKTIEVGDEICVSYGDNYFGEDNADCLCHTCEDLVRNGWDPAEESAFTDSNASTPVPEIGSAKKGLSMKRKRSTDLDEDTSSERSTPVPKDSKRLKTYSSSSKLRYSWTPPSTSDSEVGRDDDEDIVMSDEPRQVVTAIRRSTQADAPLLLSPKGSLSSIKRGRGRPRGSGALNRKDYPLSPPATSGSSQDSEGEGIQLVKPKIEEDAEIDTIETYIPIAAELTERWQLCNLPRVDGTLKRKLSRSLSTPSNITVTTIAEIVPRSYNMILKSDSITNSAILPSQDGLAADTIAINPTANVDTDADMRIEARPLPNSDPGRTPGDYVLTRKLLAQPHDRWVRCQNEHCHGFFLQANGYSTRRECPRCERHSMLYGFEWPKTDPDARKLLARELERKKNQKITAKAKKGEDQGNGATNTIMVSETVIKKRSKGEIEQTGYSAYNRQGRCGKGTWVVGGGDEEERVMDHRTVHRFVLPEDEKELSRKGLLLAAEQLRDLGEGGMRKYRALDGKGKLREGTAETEDGSEEGSSQDGDSEGPRRRSGRIVESRVYKFVDMKR